MDCDKFASERCPRELSGHVPVLSYGALYSRASSVIETSSSRRYAIVPASLGVRRGRPAVRGTFGGGDGLFGMGRVRATRLRKTVAVAGFTTSRLDSSVTSLPSIGNFWLMIAAGHGAPARD